MNVVLITGTVSSVLAEGDDPAVLIETFEDAPQVVLTRVSGAVACAEGEHIEARGRLLTESVRVGGTVVCTTDGRPIHRSVFQAECITPMPTDQSNVHHHRSMTLVPAAFPRPAALPALISSKESNHAPIPELPWR